MSLRSESECARSVAPHVRVLRRVGFLRGAALSSRGRARRLALRGYHALALAATSLYVLQQAVYAYQERGDMDKLSQVMFLMLCHMTCVVKQIAFHVDADRIDRLIASLDEPLLNQCAGERGALLRGTARGAARLLRTYAGCAVATCVLWIVFPVINRIQGISFEFPFWTGFSYDHNAVFTLVLLQSFYCTNLVAIGNTSMDAFMATILDQCKTQLRILRINFESLPERARALHVESGENYDTILDKLFVDCLVHYNKITEMCTELHDVFAVPLLVQFGVGGWILCMAAYKIVSLDVLSIEFASITLFITCILIELFIFCYYGNEVTVESERVSQSLYSMEWRRARLTFRRSLVLVMERAKRPLRPAAGRVIPLSLDTFVKILKSSYSFYAVLRQTK
ncbi:odorant receptor 4-like [Helicoverpa zea]|uniref:odorant receptor 4-like n=1 Tax=Helicoverpa zea TaxID=7113 RepID=UPI001F57A05A|nr:odorant receptor 4-like [Helicoverpa zea]